jgi:mevalonate kinase
MRMLALAAMLFAALGTASAMACTQDELLAKAQALNAKLQALAAKDPNKANAWAQKVSAANQHPASTIDEACTMYDGWLADIDKQ